MAIEAQQRHGLRLAAGAATRPRAFRRAEPGSTTVMTRRMRFRRAGGDLRLKILSLLLLSALGPVLLVGSASYLTARSIMGEKITSQLDGQASWVADRVSDFIENRSADVSVFSEALIVAEELRLWSWARRAGDEATAAEATARLTRYLEQISERYPLYEALAVVDREGNLAAMEGSVGRSLPQLIAAGEDALLVGDGQTAHLAVRQPVPGGEGVGPGLLIAVSGLDELWRDLSRGPHSDSHRLRVIDTSVRALFDSRPAEAGVGMPAGPEERTWELLRRGPTAEYRGADGRAVLGALRFLEAAPVGILVETERAGAFAAIYRLRDFTLLVSILSTLLVAAIGFGLLVNLTRPIEALIVGAKAAARGDLSREVPVSSDDQIGYLTRVFNRMIRTIRDSRTRLELLSSTDALTGLLNRRDLAGRFDAELSRAVRCEDTLSVLMIDIDRFKAFNDRRGHLAGDAVLHRLGDFLTRCLRSIDVAARYGGEEFLVLLPSTDKEGAADLAERLRRSFNRVQQRSGGPAVTLSFGVAAFPADGATADELVCAADAALYEAKRGGRDRVEVASETGLRAVAPAGRGSMP